MANSVPDRWLEYKPVGDVIKGTQILAFKVPLKDYIVRNLEPDQRFTPRKLLQDHPRIKYIVDLTNTFRYYDKEEFTNVGVKYHKITIPGRQVPPKDIIEQFFKVMDEFTSACGEGELVGVHCTHGVNRTGYLICRYLIQQLGWELQTSLKAFEEARGYPIEREVYLTALKEVPRGEKINTNKVVLTPTISMKKQSAKSHFSMKPPMGPMGPPGFAMPRRGSAYPPQRFSFGGPGFRPMPPPPGLPPIPPPMGPPPYGSPRPHRYGMLMRPPPPAPGPGFPRPGFPLRIPGPPRMAGPPRLPPVGPAARLPPPKMPPPPPPPPPHSRTGMGKQSQTQKKKQLRNGIMERAINVRTRRNGPPVSSRIVPKIHKEQDFTVDTFEENLLTTSTNQLRRVTRGRYSQAK